MVGPDAHAAPTEANGQATDASANGARLLGSIPRDGAHHGRNGRSGRNGARRAALLTVVVPTKNEAGNVRELSQRLGRILPPESEILFVDDSSDDTPAEVARARRRLSIPIRLIHRPEEERNGGLAGAVVAGLRASQARFVCVIDADLQHPPERVPDLLARAEEGDVDVVVASRYAAGGTSNFGRLRGLVSTLSTKCALVLFPRRLRGVSDPMSGFFLVRRESVDPGALRPRGFKILLEILARTPRLRVAEIPFSFGERHADESKASVGEGLAYAGQLVALRAGSTARRFTRFGLVGASGLVVNMAVFAALHAIGLHYLLAALLATSASTLWLFVLTDRWVFAGRDTVRSTRSRLGLYVVLNYAGFLVRAPILVLLVAALGLDPLAGNLASLLVLTLARFAVADTWIWKTADGGGPRGAVIHAYDIHGLLAVDSDVALPELERFHVPALRRRPHVSVRTGALSRKQSELARTLAFAGRHIRYDEGLGRLGFAVDIASGRRTTIVASPLLRASPHVLYTNVVEPVLRWAFVQKGYALVHAACISFDGEAVLVTARTDTGKTTTILKALDSYDCGFLSDDLTLLAPDGRVLTYPKPLTVSSHTVGAVSTPRLTFRQRLGLPLQSRIHSRSGRRFAFVLTKTRLPVATINAIVQLVVPPPKYHVDRLVPRVEFVTSARLRHLVVIERGPDAVTSLTGAEAVTTLLRNCEDAYGFPPYETIANFLHGDGRSDLHAVERSIVTSALAGSPATAVRSKTMDWWRHLPSVLGTAAPEPHPSRPQEVMGSAVGLSIAQE